jgi:hypothetical protein
LPACQFQDRFGVCADYAVLPAFIFLKPYLYLSLSAMERLSRVSPLFIYALAFWPGIPLRWFVEFI